MTIHHTPVLGGGPAASERIAPGTVLGGKYRVDRVIAEGGMGYVVAATHIPLQARVALKLLLPEHASNRELVERFLREARSAAMLKGEHVARVIDSGTLTSGAPYMEMEYLDGADLAALLATNGRLPPGEIVDILLPVCEALAEAHARGIIHRDLKPGNVFLARRPDGSRLVKVLDFGISKALGGSGPALTRSLTAMGTPAYMSPEQLRSARDVDGRTDIWSLGVVLHECVVGRRPFEADSVPGLCLAVAEGAMQPLPGWLPARIAEVIRRCLARDPNRRWATMGELAAALAPLASDPQAARTVVERTRALEGGVATLEPGRVPSVRGDATTLGGSTVVTRGSGRPLAWTATGLGALAVVGVVWLVVARLGRGGGASTAAPTVEAAFVSTTPRVEVTSLAPSAADALVAPALPTIDSGEVVGYAARGRVTAPAKPSPAVRASRAAPTPGVAAPPAPAPAPLAPPTPAAVVETAVPPPTSTVTIRVYSVPNGATVTRAADGVELGYTPFETTMPRGAGSVRYQLTLTGHVAEQVAFDLDPPGPIVGRNVMLRVAPVAMPKADASRAPSSRGRGQPALPGDL